MIFHKQMNSVKYCLIKTIELLGLVWKSHIIMNNHSLLYWSILIMYSRNRVKMTPHDHYILNLKKHYSISNQNKYLI